MTVCPIARPQQCRIFLSDCCFHIAVSLLHVRSLIACPLWPHTCNRCRYRTTDQRQCGFTGCSNPFPFPLLFLRFTYHHLGAAFSRPGIGNHSHLHFWRQFRASRSEPTRTQSPKIRRVDDPRSQHQVIKFFSKGVQSFSLSKRISRALSFDCLDPPSA